MASEGSSDDGGSAEVVTGRAAVIDALVAAATRLFAASGPDRVTLRAVAAEAGVNYGLIHQYVGSKDDLLRLVVRAVSTQSAEDFAASDVEGVLRRLVRVRPTDYTATLTWALLQGRDPATLLGPSPGLGALVARAGDIDERDERVAAVVAMALGWQVYGSFIRAGLGRDDADAEAFTEVLQRIGRSILAPDQRR